MLVLAVGVVVFDGAIDGERFVMDEKLYWK
jgi:hypothetical protein